VIAVAIIELGLKFRRKTNVSVWSLFVGQEYIRDELSVREFISEDKKDTVCF
jgi:hypothetical protein